MSCVKIDMEHNVIVPREFLTKLKNDLLIRGECDGTGCNVVNLSSSLWLQLKELESHVKGNWADRHITTDNDLFTGWDESGSVRIAVSKNRDVVVKALEEYAKTLG